jgi:hypothetical protein
MYSTASNSDEGNASGAHNPKTEWLAGADMWTQLKAAKTLVGVPQDGGEDEGRQNPGAEGKDKPGGDGQGQDGERLGERYQDVGRGLGE